MSGFPSPGNLLSAPKDWTRVRFKFAVDYINEKVDFAGDGEYVALENISSWTSLRLTSEAPLAPSSQTNRFQSGDVLFGKLRPYLAKVLLANFDGYASSECLVLRGKAVLPAFVRYWCLSKDFIELVDGSTFGSKMPRADWDFIGNTVALIPPLQVQQAIAAHLDRETAKIDTLIAKKRELIAKLKEQRSALISRTVTRGLPPEAAQAAGLDPNPPMKDSGVAWLSVIPQRWQALSLKRILSLPMTDGPHETPEFLLSGIPFVSVEAVWDGAVHLSSVRGYISLQDHQRYAQKFKPGRNDVFIVKSGSTTGKVCIVDFDDEFNIWSPLAACRFQTSKADAYFMFLAVGSEYFQNLIQVSWSFGTQPNIGMSVLENLMVILPPVEEQLLIVSYLKKRLAKIDQGQVVIETAITRLTEYRAALITAAVTGQIDVR